MKLAHKIEENAKKTPKITTIEQNLSQLVIQMTAVTQRISNLEDNLQEDKNTALVTNKLEHESADSNIIAIIFILQDFINLFVGADYYPNFNAFKQSISDYSSTYSTDLGELYLKVEQKQSSSYQKNFQNQNTKLCIFFQTKNISNFKPTCPSNNCSSFFYN